MTDKSMIERVARVMAVADDRDPDKLLLQQRCEAHLSPKKVWHLYISKARAALEAMREPTQSMISAGGATAFGGAGDPAFADMAADMAKDAYKAMIDAALREAAE